MTGAREGPGHRFSDDFLHSKLRVALTWLIAAKISGLLVLVDPWSVQSSDLPKSIFSRATAWLMAGLLAAIWMHYRRVGPSSVLHVAVIALVAANLVSVITAE